MEAPLVPPPLCGGQADGESSAIVMRKWKQEEAVLENGRRAHFPLQTSSSFCYRQLEDWASGFEGQMTPGHLASRG